jgi:hypothetical protein
MNFIKPNTIKDFLLVPRFKYLINKDEERLGQTGGVF